jgi:hypothetical protein
VTSGQSEPTIHNKLSATTVENAIQAAVIDSVRIDSRQHNTPRLASISLLVAAVAIAGAAAVMSFAAWHTSQQQFPTLPAQVVTTTVSTVTVPASSTLPPSTTHNGGRQEPLAAPVTTTTHQNQPTVPTTSTTAPISPTETTGSTAATQSCPKGVWRNCLPGD